MFPLQQIMQILPQFKANPAQFLGQLPGVNMQDPNAIIQHLMNSGKVNQQQYNNVVNFLNQQKK